MLQRLGNINARDALRSLYGPSVVKQLLYPLALWRYRSPLQDPSCDHYACGCVWCEHGVVGHDHGGRWLDATSPRQAVARRRHGVGW